MDYFHGTHINFSPTFETISLEFSKIIDWHAKKEVNIRVLTLDYEFEDLFMFKGHNTIDSVYISA